MTITLAEPIPAGIATPSQRLRLSTAAVRVSLKWFGVRKTLTPEQKSEAAEPFGAQGDYLSARKKILDTKHPAYKEVTGVRGKVISFWKGQTLPYPEPGVRLIKQNQIEVFNQQMLDFRDELGQAVVRLEEHYGELKAAARRRLGTLFNPADYPELLAGLFAIDWDFPSVEPPDYLLQLSPALYEQERARVAARFEEAIRLAEQAFLAEFAKLVSHLSERLADETSGKRKTFRDTVVTNLLQFFERFKELNVRSNPDLDDLVAQAQRIVSGVEAQALRDNEALRQHVAQQILQVQTVIDEMMVDQPRRRIIRSAPSTNGAIHGSGN